MKKQDYTQLTLFQEDSPVNHSVWQESAKGKTMIDSYGLRCAELSENLNRLGLLVKMFLESSRLPDTRFARTWRVKDTLSPYLIMKLRVSERRTGEKECSLWRTPDAHCDRGWHTKETQKERIKKGLPVTLNDQVNHTDLFRLETSKHVYYANGERGAKGNYEPGHTKEGKADRESITTDSAFTGWESWTGRTENTEIWVTEPNVGRVANGIPDRVDRLKALGNAVVPQQIYPIFRGIAEIERGVKV